MFRKVSARVPILAVILWARQAWADQPADAPPVAPVTLLFHADLGGQFVAPGCGDRARASGGYAGVVGALRARRSETGPVALLGGNWSGPDPFAATLLATGAEGARTLAALLARGGYDAVALGHDELSLEPATLDLLLPALARQGLPLLATNLTCTAGRTVCASVRREVVVRRPSGVVGVLATISPSVVDGIPHGHLAGLALGDPAAAIRSGIARLRAAGATTIVVMTDGPRDTRAVGEIEALARQLDGGAAPAALLSAGLTDSAGRALRLLRRDGAPAIIGSPSGAGGLAAITFAGGDVAVDAIPPGVPDATTVALAAPTAAAACRDEARTVAPAGVRRSLTQDEFVTYVLEVLRRRTGAEIAVVNRAFVKAAPFPITGPLTRGDLDRALPYRAVIGSARVTGPLVESLLGAALTNPKLAVVGLAKEGGALKVNGRGLDKARAYRVATIAFVAGGGDGIFAPHALPFAPTAGARDLREEVEAFLRHETAAEDRDPTVDPRTDFGPPPGERSLWVALADGGFDLSNTAISNGPGYGSAQLTRAQQTLIKGQATLVLQLRQPRHELDGRFDAQYGWSETEPLGMPKVSGETVDLITAIANYTFRGLRDWRRVPRPLIPDPYARVWLESEFTRPDVTATQPRSYHHLQLTDTAGAQLTPIPRLRLRGGAGVQTELLASGPAGNWRALIEAGATLDPTALATVGPLAIKLEGMVEYNYIDPIDSRQHQLRGNAKLSAPLLPALFLTVGVDVFAIAREGLGWGASYDTTIGLRVHGDLAHQRL
jgi:2',3'-cyclic-nucleotide 2'-phosphodiesterase (5'-nucleotidase family)